MPWDPVRDLLVMQERLESLFGPFAPGWIPPADLRETADEFLLSIEVPGLEREDVQIEFHDGTLTVRGRRAHSGHGEKYQQFERSQGPFSRSFQFGPTALPTDIAADLTDGVLTIRVPKATAPRAQRIDVE